MKRQSDHETVLKRQEEARKLRAEGLSIRQIAEKMGGMSTGAVSYYIYGYKGKTMDSPEGAKAKKARKPRVVSVLGGTTAANGLVHHEWFLAGYLTRYAQDHDLDVKGLAQDVKTVIEGGK